ncbi:unnamed protein product [Cladocopium goreaui]|uniref:Fe2OG dioxygenase domain-containing protein n=1 Tax=Cladocopium goreaui TaxID=2562237 RepID=A0A9P1C689_9DINO|nr:unnamed protein product [Cladocopium goreaui]
MILIENKNIYDGFHVLQDPFAARFVPFPPTDERRIYSKVHAICPDGQHRAILLSLPCGCKPAAESGESGQSRELLARSSQLSQQLSFKCSLLRRSIERGRLFGGGRKAVEEAFTAILDSPEPSATASALRCLTLVSMEAVRLWKARPEHVSFGSLAMLAILASSVPSWRPPLALREALLRTVAAVQAADQPESCMPWRNWRKPEIGGDDGGLEFQNDDLSQLRNALRHLTRGFLGCLAAEEADMVGRYTDVMVNRGGLPLYHLPLPRPEMEETLPSDYRSAAVDCSVLPQLPLHFQAALTKPPLCESTNLKDLHLRNLRFFIEQTQFNIRQQKDIKRRGGYIEAGDMERIVNYMDEEHFAQGRDLAEARALPEDSRLREVNSEGFTSEEECHLQSERCRSLQETLKSLQKQTLQRSLQRAALKPRQDDSVPLEGATCVESIDPSARLDAFLSCFGGSVEVKIPGKDVRGHLRVTCARKDTPKRPLLIQKAQKVSATGDRDGAFQEVLDTTLREAATKEFCKSFGKGALPRPPQGYVWNVPGPDGPGVLRVEQDDGDQLRFFVGEVELQPFDAGPILWKCIPQPQLCSKADEDPKERKVVQKALYLQPAQQVDLLQELQGRSQRTAGVLSWLEDAKKSGIAACIWQEAYARLVLEEEHEGHPCLTLSASHPYAGTLYRIVLLLAFLYPSVLVPTRSELAFRIFRESKVQGCLHQHLKNALKILAFNQQSSVRAGAFQGKVITPLFTYQTEAVQRLLQSRHNGAAGSLDASSLGAGKTLVAISFCMFLAAQHSGGEFLVLVPSSSLMDGWRQQIEQHTEGVRVQMQQENGVLREGVQRKSPNQTSPLRRKRPATATWQP